MENIREFLEAAAPFRLARPQRLPESAKYLVWPPVPDYLAGLVYNVNIPGPAKLMLRFRLIAIAPRLSPLEQLVLSLRRALEAIVAVDEADVVKLGEDSKVGKEGVEDGALESIIFGHYLILIPRLRNSRFSSSSNLWPRFMIPLVVGRERSTARQ